jgi:hypothetical protein
MTLASPKVACTQAYAMSMLRSMKPMPCLSANSESQLNSGLCRNTSLKIAAFCVCIRRSLNLDMRWTALVITAMNMHKDKLHRHAL